MGRIVVCGGGVVGLSAALMLARDGHTVTVLEVDPVGPPPEPVQAWDRWRRTGVAHFRQPHNLLPRFRQVLAEELPDMTGRLLAAGCVLMDTLTPMPPGIEDQSPRPEDDRFRFVSGRRPVVESVFAAAAEEQADVTVRRGVRVAGLLGGPPRCKGIPHVAGVRLSDGEEIRADLVVDATGRRTAAPRWLAHLGAEQPATEKEQGGFAYYTRYFTGPQQPLRRGAPLTPLGTVSLLTIPGDNDTWSITVVGSAKDAPLRAIRDPECFTRLVRACPAQAHWLAGTPISDVLVTAGILNRRRRFVVDGRPVATGFAAVSDAWACTNPTAARGLSVGVLHVQQLRRTVRAHVADPEVFASAWDKATEQYVAPFYQDQIAADRVRIAEMDALREGDEPPLPDPVASRFAAAALRDAEVFRALLEAAVCLTPRAEVLARPDLMARIDKRPPQPLASRGEAGPPALDRAQLLRLLGE
ncbi:NAD(P)/FAD-dependent oxidoreductase [Streptomyces sp. RPT161]|uniref:NAD(P)/FAD-dependent oxidoreductase n=1 Tax=Streptomyces sp. RPT161 TaxID=3015993 RepID=UPI0022B90100|nr:FAD-dependent oxidoreductase [Streptomyces sp. RPT161]